MKNFEKYEPFKISEKLLKKEINLKRMKENKKVKKIKKKRNRKKEKGKTKTGIN